MKLKTTTKIGLRFTLFNVLILVSFGSFINIFYFFSWYNDEKKDLLKDIEKIVYQKGNLKDNILKYGGYIKTTGKNYISNKFKKEFSENENLFMHIFENEDKYFLYMPIKSKYGLLEFSIFYDITPYVNSQINIIFITLFLIIFFGIFSYIISIYFTKESFKKIIQIADFSKKISLYKKTPQLKFDDLPDNDEIKILSDNLNKTIQLLKKQSDKIKQFSYDVSHEIKTPLMLINSTIELSLLKNDEKNGLLEIKKDIKKINNIAELLLMISEINSDKIKINLEEVNLKTFIKTIIDNLKNKYSKKNIKLEIYINENDKIKTDKLLFEILVKNIIDNAFKYCEKNGTIEISYTNGQLEITNTGKEIVNENIDKIWGIFWKDDKARTEYDSYGLGLSLVKKISKILNYNISVKSKENKTSFYIFTNKND